MTIFRKQFRKVNNKQNTQHPAYIYAKVGDKYKFLGITHSKITNNLENIKLDKNPDPKDNRESFVRPIADKADKSVFGKGLNNWHFGNNDLKTINKIIDKNEKPKKKK